MKRASGGELVWSSPGWTRTNNPPVNSRMLCQLSYRGSAAAHCSRRLRRIRGSRSRTSASRCWSSRRCSASALGELAVQAPLAQPQQQLLGRLLVDLVGVGHRVELGEERRQLAVRAASSPRRCARTRRWSSSSKCSGPSSSRIAVQLRVRGDAGERASLEPRAGVEQARRDAPRARAAARRREAGLGFRRQVEQVGREPQRVELLGRVGSDVRNSRTRRTRAAVARPLDAAAARGAPDS